MKYPEQIEIVWTVDDVLGLSPTSGGRTYSDLGMTRQEAAKVLNEVKRTHDANYGVTWDTLLFWAQELFGDKYGI
jgi:hypothetical protein